MRLLAERQGASRGIGIATEAKWREKILATPVRKMPPHRARAMGRVAS
jgi:hypothetical protein